MNIDQQRRQSERDARTGQALRGHETHRRGGAHGNIFLGLNDEDAEGEWYVQNQNHFDSWFQFAIDFNSILSCIFVI